MAQCLIPNCPNDARNNVSIRCRRPATTAIWAPNTTAYLCDDHADQGFIIDIILTPVATRTITTRVTAGRRVRARTTPIEHHSIE